MNLVVLDRDGVINHDSPDYIKSPDEWVPVDGSLAAIARLNRAGYRVVVFTNQSGLRRKLFSIETLTRIHAKMQRMAAEAGGHLDAIFICPCLPKDQCECYKPNPGMLRDLAERLKISLVGVPVVGDAARDLEAARAVGARPILVRTGRGEETIEAGEGLEGVTVCADLSAAVDDILRTHGAVE